MFAIHCVHVFTMETHITISNKTEPWEHKAYLVLGIQVQPKTNRVLFL